MRSPLIRPAILLWLSIGVFFSGNCNDWALAAESNQRPVKQITFALGWEPISFYPLRALDSASYYGQGLVYQGLLKYDHQLKIVPAIAKSFAVTPDGLRYTFLLKEGVRFNNGSPVAVEDVVQSIKQAKAPDSPYQLDYEDISRVETDGRTITLVLSHPCAPLLSRLVELRVMPAAILNLPDHGRNEMSRHPVGSGPFILKSWESGSELVFEPNPYYDGPVPAYDRLVWKIVPDHSLLALALKNGEIDVAQCESQDWACFLSKTQTSTLRLERFPGTRTIFLGFNCGKAPFNDVAVRRALSQAINRQALIEKLYAGYATIATSDFALSSWVYNEHARRWPYDPPAAEKALELAGYEKVGAHWRSKETKEPLAFRIFTVKEYESIAEAAATDLHKIGILTEVQLLEFSSLRQLYLKKGAFQAVVWSRSVGPDPECYLVWHSHGPLNMYRWGDARMDKLLELGRRELEPAKRREYYLDVQTLLSNDLPWLFLVHPDLLLVHNAQVRNVQEPGQNRTGLPWDNPLFNAADWIKD
jgi:peptide/nickel transport system substrate-binding protein